MVHTGVPREPSAAHDPLARAFEDGRRAGLAAAAVAASVIAFVSLFGAEKALLAIALGLLAWRGSAPGSAARRLAAVAVGVATVFLVSVAVVLIVFWDELVGLVHHLQKLS